MTSHTNKVSLAADRHVAERSRFTVDGWKVEQQFDASGNHRLVVASLDKEEGEWTSYSSISTFKNRYITLYGTADYYDGMLPRVFRITSGTEGWCAMATAIPQHTETGFYKPFEWEGQFYYWRTVEGVHRLSEPFERKTRATVQSVRESVFDKKEA